MERQYKAFISYRHLPLDKETAIQVHRAIEHFVIPRALRKDGQRKLGYVFRDEDELPVAGELTENIRLALENSEYLIVICTPETCKSAWVLKEVETFLRLRDRNHILLVLADGEPAESFPRVITELRDESGRQIGEYEPMAANLNAPGPTARKRKFKVEILRILAGLLGCPFDELYQRERRYQRRRAGSLLALAALVAVGFIGMLLNRNAEIRRQLELSRENESRALAALSETAYLEGRYDAALSYSIEALPGPEDARPYVPEAEAALRMELALYDSSFFTYFRSIEQDTRIRCMAMSEDGTRLFTADPYGCIRAYDLDSGACLWTAETGEGATIEKMFLGCGGSRLLVKPFGVNSLVLSAEDGSLIWKDRVSATFSREDRSIFMVTDFEEEGKITVLSAVDGSELRVFHLSNCPTRSIYEMALSHDERYLAFVGYAGDRIELAVLNMETGRARLLPAELAVDWDRDYQLSFSPTDMLALASLDSESPARIQVFSPEDDWSRARVIETDLQYRFRGNLGTQIDLFDWSGDSVLLGAQMYLRSYDAATGEQDWSLELEGNLCGCRVYDNGSLALVMDTGLIHFTTDGEMLDKQRGFSFSTRYPLSSALVCGERYASSRFLLLPQGAENRAALVEAPAHEDWQLLATEGEEYQRGAKAVLSASGEKLAVYQRDRERMEGCAFDLREGSSIPFSIPLPEDYFESSRQYVLTEDLVLLNGATRYLLREQRMEKLSQDPEGSDLYSDYYCFAVREDGTVLTMVNDPFRDAVFLWRDGRYDRQIEAPEQVRGADCCALGGNGWALLRRRHEERYAFWAFHPESGRLLPLPELDRDDPVPGFSDVRAQMVWLGDDALELYDLEQGQLLWQVPLPVPADSLAHMSFFRDDSLLLLFTKQGDVLICDAASGELLSRCAIGNSNVSLSRETSFTLRELPEREQLLIFVNERYYTESFYLLLDTESWTLLEACSAPLDYDAANERMLIMARYNGLYSAPLYTREELVALAEKRLGIQDR